MSDIFESKWGETKAALTEGLAGNKKKTMDVVLENTKRYLAEQSTAGATSAGNVATLNRVILPVIRRVMPTVIANEIVGVQPMTGPVGQIHTLRIRYAATVSSNWERNDQFFGYIGSGMSQSSGEFTFPETGIYKVKCFYGGFLSSGNAGYMGIQMRVSSNSGSGYSNIASSYQHVTSGPSNPHFSGTTEAFIDVTDASTFRVKLLVDRNASTTFFGHTDRNMTGLTFIRLGDT